MAKTSVTTPRDYEAIGPTQSGNGGYGPGKLPMNPSDQIFSGSQLPIRMPEALTMRRTFNEATRSPLHYNDGPGTDEVVTSRRPNMPPLLGNDHAMGDHFEDRPMPGFDHNLYAARDDNSKTLNGADIYGT